MQGGQQIPMKTSRTSLTSLCLFLGLLGIVTPPPAAHAASGDEEIVAVSSRASKSYVRAKLSDGSFEPETYAFGNGGHVGAAMVDGTIDKLGFMDVARMAAGPLEDRKYVPAKDPNKTNLLIMVYWGMTTGTSHATDDPAYQNAQAAQKLGPPPPPPKPGGSMAGPGPATAQTIDEESLQMMMVANMQRDDADVKNAMLLGYDSELMATKGLENTALRGYHNDLIEDLEDNRYFVVLMAYDFPTLLKQKKHKLQWVTRISLRQRGHDFGKALPAMMTYASKYFGEETDGLVRDPIPEGHVEVGEVKTIGEVPQK
jgi:hypothetical protein